MNIENELYEGTFFNNYLEGYGRKVCANGTVQRGYFRRTIYKGEFIRDQGNNPLFIDKNKLIVAFKNSKLK